MIIGLISDTHGLLRPEIVRVFAGVDCILHAGDVGSNAVLEGLARIAPVEAVFGNVDDPHDPMLARARTLTRNGLVIHVSHGHELGRPTAELMLLAIQRPWSSSVTPIARSSSTRKMDASPSTRAPQDRDGSTSSRVSPG